MDEQDGKEEGHRLWAASVRSLWESSLTVFPGQGIVMEEGGVGQGSIAYMPAFSWTEDAKACSWHSSRA